MNNKKQSNMESKGKNIPKLRFPGFEGEWEVKKLGEISSVFQGYGFPEKYQGETNGDIPFYKVSDISFSTDKGNKYILDAKNYIDKETLPLLHAKLIPIGSTIFAKIGEAIRKNNRAITKVPCLIDNNAAAIKAKENISLDEFLFYTMSQIELINYAGGVVPAVTKTAIESIQVPIPTLPEQQKIASCLSSLDGQISAEQSRLESLSQHKRGLMQQLFPQEGENAPKLRFPGFEGDWEAKKLGEICGIISPSTKLQSSEYLKSGKYPIVDQSQSFICGWTNEEKGLVDDPPVIIFGDHTCVLKFVDFPFFQGADGVKILKAIKKNNARFVYQSFLANPIKQEGYKRHFSDLKEKAFYFPPTLPEQEKIASCLTAIDNLIAAQQERIEALKQHKRGLMQQLFPAVANE